jgi:glycosyltransferase involved in cell wall biosynthesis
VSRKFLLYAEWLAHIKASLYDFLRRVLMSPLADEMRGDNQRAISVIIPTYYRSSALVWCLEHLEVQTFRNFDVIIVDDGSGDDTSDAVASYKANSALEILYMRQENGGPAKARNAAVRATRSPVCLLIGDDILASPQMVEQHLDLQREQPELATCGLGLTLWERERQQLTPFMRYFEEIQFAYADLRLGIQPDWRHFYTSNLSVKTELLRRYPFNERFSKAAMEDVELAYRISRSEKLKMVFLPQATAFHYHPTSLLQACQRNVSIGRSIHLFEECWPDAGAFIPPLSGWRKTLGQIFDHAALRTTLTRVLSSLERFYCNARLTRQLLDSYQRSGYNSRETEIGMSSRQSLGRKISS